MYHSSFFRSRHFVLTFIFLSEKDNIIIEKLKIRASSWVVVTQEASGKQMQMSIKHIHNREGGPKLLICCDLWEGDKQSIASGSWWCWACHTGPGVKKYHLEGLKASLCMQVEDNVFTVNVYNFSDNRLSCSVQRTKSNSHLSFPWISSHLILWCTRQSNCISTVWCVFV